MKKLIVLRGVMGAGKTHFATHFAKDNDYKFASFAIKKYDSERTNNVR